MGGRSERATHLHVVTMGREARSAAEKLRESDVLREHLPDSAIDDLARELDSRKTIHVNEQGEVVTPDGVTTGRTLEELADETNFDLRLVGNQQRMDFSGVAGGDLSVLHSVIKLRAGEYSIKGQFRAGDKVELIITVEVDEVRFKRLRDGAHGPVYGVQRIHECEMPDYVQRAPESPDEL